MNQKFNTVELTKMALLTALICVSAYIVIPLPFTPASLTAQTLVVNLIALLLTPRQAAFTMVVYILLGLTGLPVFSGGMGGPGKLFGPTGGYIMSWIPAVMLMSWLKGKYYSFKRYCLVTILVGMPVIYLIGSAYQINHRHSNQNACDLSDRKCLYEIHNRNGLGSHLHSRRNPIHSP